MIKRYCDACEQPMPDKADAFEFELGNVKVKLTIAVNGVWNRGDVCLPCLLSVVWEGQATVRPRLANGGPIIDLNKIVRGGVV